VSISKLVKRLSIFFTLILFLVLVPVIFLLTLDPNDYKPEIESLARDRGVDLQINGALAWQLYPTLALELNDVAFAADQPAMSISASLDLAQLDINLLPLFSGELSFGGVRVEDVNLALTEVALTEAATEGPQPAYPESTAEEGTMESAGQLSQLNAQRISLRNLKINYQPLANQSTQLAFNELSAEQFNLAGHPFRLSLGLDLGYADQKLTISMDSQLLLDLETQHYRVETQGLQIGVAGERTIQSPVDLVADVNMQSGNWTLSLDNMHLDDLAVEIAAMGTIDPLTAKGNLHIIGGAGFINWVTSKDLLRELSLESEFDYRAESLVLNGFSAKINESQIDLGLQYYPQGHQASQLRLNIGLINVDQYLPAQADETATEPVQNPLEFLDMVPAFDIQLTVDGLTYSDYHLGNIQLNSQISNAIANVALEHADFADGTLEAGLVLQANNQPQVRVDSLQATNVQLGQFVLTETGELLIQGEAIASFSGELVSLIGEDYLTGLNGDGVVSVDGLSLRNWNIEQNICLSAERLGGTQALQSSWPANTEFASFSSPVAIRNGVVTLQEITSGFGNITFTGGGNFDLVSLDLAAQLALLIQGERTSEQGCSINRFIRNTELPLSCEGNAGQGGEISCGLDNAVIQAHLTGQVQNAIQERLQRMLAPEDDSGEQEEAEEVEDPTMQLFQEALRGILRPNPR